MKCETWCIWACALSAGSHAERFVLIRWPVKIQLHRNRRRKPKLRVKGWGRGWGPGWGRTENREKQGKTQSTIWDAMLCVFCIIRSRHLRRFMQMKLYVWLCEFRWTGRCFPLSTLISNGIFTCAPNSSASTGSRVVFSRSAGPANARLFSANWKIIWQLLCSPRPLTAYLKI